MAEALRPEPIVRFEHVTKTFPGIRALDDVSFSIQEGEVHCLLGENGAGNSDEDSHRCLSCRVGQCLSAWQKS